MPKNIKRKVRAAKRAPRRRLTAPMPPTLGGALTTGYDMYKTYQRGKEKGVQRRRAIRNIYRSEAVTASDNVTTLKQTVIGKPRKPSFAEKVARVERPPILFKRNYQFSAECLSGRKAWFNMNLNHSSNDLNADTLTYGQNLLTDTNIAESIATTPGQADRFKFYIDYMSSKLQFMNSGTNSLTGKLHLFAFKRDAKSHYVSNTPINPVNLMMYYSAAARGLQNPNYEATVGNGWNFDLSTANYNYGGNYNMPGSSLNASGVCAFTDLALSPSSSHIKTDMGFWFRPIATQSFSLKPGQQVNKVIKFYDLPAVCREQMDSEYFAGVSHAIAVEFQGQIVGDISNNNVISTGLAQLSVIREDVRILGQKNQLKSKVLLQTSPLTTIIRGQQLIINPDSGTQLVGYQDDS